MKKDMICIICPRGCHLTCTTDETSTSVTGNACPKGEAYAIAELTHPTRTVTSTVRVVGRPDTMVSVKTVEPIPKEQIGAVMKHIRAAEATPPIAIGDIILPDVCGTNIIATKAVKE